MTKKRAAIILAAGKGKRMESDLAKVVHEVHGQPMISILMETLEQLNLAKRIVVIGHRGEDVKAVLTPQVVTAEGAQPPPPKIEFAWQKEQLGTGHAVSQTYKYLCDFVGTTLVALGDVPFLSKETIEKLFERHEKTQAAATCLSAEFDDPTGYGRIIRKEKTDILMGIVEHNDASLQQLRIKEINSGTFCFDNQQLFKYLKQVGSNNTQGEYYLTDVIKLMYDNGLRVSVVKAENPDEVRGINSFEQLKELEMIFSRREYPK